MACFDSNSTTPISSPRLRPDATMTDLEKQDTNPADSQSQRSRKLERITTDPSFGDRGSFTSDDTTPDDSAPVSRGPSNATGRDSLAQTTSRISRRETAVSKIRSRAPIGQFTHPLEHQKTSVDDLVDFDGADDPYRPVNWTMKKKCITTGLYGLTTMVATWASATYSAGQGQVQKEFNVGWPVATLGTTLFLFGFGIGPLLWAVSSPISSNQ